MQANRSCSSGGCPLNLDRRGLLIAAGAVAAATKMGLFEFASTLFAAKPGANDKARVCAAFLRPKQEQYWMGWPGAAYDVKARQADYTRTLQDAAEKFQMQLDIEAEPLDSTAAVDGYIERLKKNPPLGVVVTIMHFGHWGDVNHFVQQRGDIPSLVFSPMGTSFTGHLQATRNAPKTFVAATQHIDWLEFAMRMFSTMAKMRSSRLCIVAGEKTEDRPLDVIGTTLHYIPRSRWPEEYKKTETSDEVKAIAEYYTKEAKKIVEPNAQDILNAARGYVTAKRIMAAENCDGISVDCLPLVRERQIPCPPCIAWLRLNDEGSVGACEADWNAAISLRLTSYLFARPGFMQDPAPNTSRNTLMGAHCSCPTKLDGFDKPHEPFILRSHSESDIGVSPQVLWRKGQEATIMKFQGPTKIILGTGRVQRNIDTPPSGGCRTSVELELDGVADARDVKGFHQLFIYGNLELAFRAYCQLAGIEVVHI